jgi:hypothetical protein
MPDINIGQQGTLRSIPKLTKINGDDYLPLVYRNMGNNHAYPFIWAESKQMGPGEWTVISGVKFHGMPAAEYCMVTVGGTENVNPYVTKDTVTNKITITAAASGTVDVMIMVGYPYPDIDAIACRGNTGAAQSLP